MTILVELDPDAGAREGDWIVRNGPGGEILSRHRTKARAEQAARKERRKRNTDIRKQNTDGTWGRF